MRNSLPLHWRSSLSLTVDGVENQIDMLGKEFQIKPKLPTLLCEKTHAYLR